MAKLQIPLNGSNITSKDRQQAFNDALEDDHQIDCGENGKITIASDEPANDFSRQSAAPQNTRPPQPNHPASEEISFPQALDHTYQHQARTMEIHQQYLAQQTEYIQLITAVLDQQGKVLNMGGGNGTAQMVETFQRTLDNFHAIREQGILVHQEFLQQQAAFSERYLQALEGGQPSRPSTQEKAPIKTLERGVTEWVVQQPAIVVDDYPPVELKSSPEETISPPSSPDLEGKADQSSGISSAELAEALLEIVAEKTGYPAEMLELNMDLEADLGIDSIKRVEILGALEDRYPTLPPADTETLGQTRSLQEILDYLDTEAGSLKSATIPAPNSPPAPVVSTADNLQLPADSAASDHPSSNTLRHALLGIVAEKTGYPSEMLEMDMDMEADLGIDSIKRVEILGAMEEQFPEIPSLDTDILAGLRTLGQIVELMGNAPPSPAVPLAVPVEDKKKAEPLSLERTPVQLKKLPLPDQLTLSPDPERPIILSDDGTKFTAVAAARLSDQGWKVVVWSYPEGLYPAGRTELSENVPVVRQSEPGAVGIQAALEEIRSTHGIPAGFIHIHPARSDSGELFSPLEEDLIKQVFLMCGSLKTDLNHPFNSGRNLLMMVLRGEGDLGVSGENVFQEGSGLAGLAKTLRWEWPDVFCRYIDLSRELENEPAASSLLAEIQDPDRNLVEVGISPTARQTLIRQS